MFPLSLVCKDPSLIVGRFSEPLHVVVKPPHAAASSAESRVGANDFADPSHVAPAASGSSDAAEDVPGAPGLRRMSSAGSSRSAAVFDTTPVAPEVAQLSQDAGLHAYPADQVMKAFRAHVHRGESMGRAQFDRCVGGG